MRSSLEYVECVLLAIDEIVRMSFWAVLGMDAESATQADRMES